jgi:hypothetical protein
MIWNDAEFYTSLFLVELEKGVPFENSPIGLYGAFTSFESPAFKNSRVKKFLETFSNVRDRIGIEVDQVNGPLTTLPGIFVFPGGRVSHGDAIDAINAHLDVPYEPLHSDFRALGFFPSRDGHPVREISKEGVVFSDKVKYGQEFTSNFPEWAIDLAESAKDHCDARLTHYKVSENGTKKKAYVHVTHLL